MTETEALLAELSATKKALRVALDGLSKLIGEHPNLAPKLRKIREAAFEAAVWMTGLPQGETKWRLLFWSQNHSYRVQLDRIVGRPWLRLRVLRTGIRP